MLQNGGSFAADVSTDLASNLVLHGGDFLVLVQNQAQPRRFGNVVIGGGTATTTFRLLGFPGDVCEAQGITLNRGGTIIGHATLQVTQTFSWTGGHIATPVFEIPGGTVRLMSTCVADVAADPTLIFVNDAARLSNMTLHNEGVINLSFDINMANNAQIINAGTINARSILTEVGPLVAGDTEACGGFYNAPLGRINVASSLPNQGGDFRVTIANFVNEGVICLENSVLTFRNGGGLGHWENTFGTMDADALSSVFFVSGSYIFGLGMPCPGGVVQMGGQGWYVVGHDGEIIVPAGRYALANNFSLEGGPVNNLVNPPSLSGAGEFTVQGTMYWGPNHGFMGGGGQAGTGTTIIDEGATLIIAGEVDLSQRTLIVRGGAVFNRGHEIAMAQAAQIWVDGGSFTVTGLSAFLGGNFITSIDGSAATITLTSGGSFTKEQQVEPIVVADILEIGVFFINYNGHVTATGAIAWANSGMRYAQAGAEAVLEISPNTFNTICDMASAHIVGGIVRVDGGAAMLPDDAQGGQLTNATVYLSGAFSWISAVSCTVYLSGNAQITEFFGIVDTDIHLQGHTLTVSANNVVIGHTVGVQNLLFLDSGSVTGGNWLLEPDLIALQGDGYVNGVYYTSD